MTSPTRTSSSQPTAPPPPAQPPSAQPPSAPAAAQVPQARTSATAGAHRADDLSGLPTGELVTRLSTQLSELVRGELELARTELTSKGKRVGTGAGLAGAAGVLAWFGVAALVAAAVAGLALVVDVWLAAVIVGVALLVIAGILALAGKSQISKATPPVPEEAVRGVQDDVATVKEATRR